MRTFVSIVLLARCMACGSGPDYSDPVTVTADQAGSTVDLAVSQELRVRLASNPSTGYSWSFTCLPADVVSALGAPRHTPQAPGVVGAGGVDTFSLTAVRAGRATLRFEYRRSWEQEVPAAEAVVFYLRVRE